MWKFNDRPKFLHLALRKFAHCDIASLRHCVITAARVLVILVEYLDMLWRLAYHVTLNPAEVCLHKSLLLESENKIFLVSKGFETWEASFYHYYLFIIFSKLKVSQQNKTLVLLFVSQFLFISKHPHTNKTK